MKRVDIADEEQIYRIVGEPVDRTVLELGEILDYKIVLEHFDMIGWEQNGISYHPRLLR